MIIVYVWSLRLRLQLSVEFVWDEHSLPFLAR